MKPKHYGLVSNSFPFDKAGFSRIKKTPGLVRAYSAIVNDFTSANSNQQSQTFNVATFIELSDVFCSHSCNQLSIPSH